jgi:hypothetical protein
MSPIPVAFPLPFDLGGVSDGVTGAVGSVGTSVAPVADTVAQTGQTVGTTIATTATTVGEAVGTAAEQVAAQIDNVSKSPVTRIRADDQEQVLKLMENWAMVRPENPSSSWVVMLICMPCGSGSNQGFFGEVVASAIRQVQIYYCHL